jgi:hypothetical protein
MTERTKSRRGVRPSRPHDGSRGDERTHRSVRREAPLISWWQTRRSGIHLPRLSSEWLEWHQTESDKRGEGG